MSNPDTDKVFTGSIPKLYETDLVPLIFEPYGSRATRKRLHRSHGSESVDA
jgi:hypothetical protein